MAGTDVQVTLDSIVVAAVAAVSGCEQAGVLVVREAAVRTAACTDELVAACDREQQRTGQGPGLDLVAAAKPVIRVEDLQADSRWPVFSPAAAKLGIRSMLCCELTCTGRERAALNLYAGAPGAFDDDAAVLGQIFALHASLALTQAQLHTQLQAAVDTRGQIGQAMGILMERHRVTPERAFQMLASASQHLNIRLRDLAGHVVHTGLDPAEVPRGGI